MLLWTLAYSVCLSLLSLLLGVRLGVESVDYVVILCVTFSGTTKLFHGICAIDVVISSAWGFQFLYTLTNTSHFSFFDNSHANGCGVSLWFWFSFPLWLMMLSIFSCAHWPFIYLLAAFFLRGEQTSVWACIGVLSVISPFPTPVWRKEINWRKVGK